MSVTRFCKFFSALALFGGFIALCAPEAVQAANKVEDAKKYTQVLKTSKSSKEKVTALNELGDLGRLMKSLVADAMPSMVASLKDTDSSVRAAAAKAVGKVDPDATAVAALTDLVKNDKDESVKMAAMQGLGAAGPAAKSAVPTLREIQKKENDKDKKSKLGKAAQDAMRAIGGKN
jgi:HEAT repeat protein